MWKQNFRKYEGTVIADSTTPELLHAVEFNYECLFEVVYGRKKQSKRKEDVGKMVMLASVVLRSLHSMAPYHTHPTTHSLARAHTYHVKETHGTCAASAYFDDCCVGGVQAKDPEAKQTWVNALILWSNPPTGSALNARSVEHIATTDVDAAALQHGAQNPRNLQDHYQDQHHQHHHDQDHHLQQQERPAWCVSGGKVVYNAQSDNTVVTIVHVDQALLPQDNDDVSVTIRMPDGQDRSTLMSKLSELPTCVHPIRGHSYATQRQDHLPDHPQQDHHHQRPARNSQYLEVEEERRAEPRFQESNAGGPIGQRYTRSVGCTLMARTMVFDLTVRACVELFSSVVCWWHMENISFTAWMIMHCMLQNCSSGSWQPFLDSCFSGITHA